MLARSPQPTLIVDLGAGDGALTRSIAQLSSSSSKSSSAPRVLAYDLVRDAAGLVARAQCSDYVPLPDGCADCVVICLALMGTDWPAIVMQARRVARKGARLLVAEVASRFVDPSSLAKQDSSSSSSSTVDGFIELVCDLGFSLKHKVRTRPFSAIPAIAHTSSWVRARTRATRTSVSLTLKRRRRRAHSPQCRGKRPSGEARASSGLASTSAVEPSLLRIDTEYPRGGDAHLDSRQSRRCQLKDTSFLSLRRDRGWRMYVSAHLCTRAQPRRHPNRRAHTASDSTCLSDE